MINGDCMKKEWKKYIFFFVLGAVIFGGISSVVAIQLYARDINYTKANNITIDVETALNELYEDSKNITYVYGENNREDGITEIEILHDCNNAVLVTGQTSLLYSINSTAAADYHGVEGIGFHDNAIGYYHKTDIVLKKGDILRLKRDTSGKFGYLLAY